ncbi:hypothetical protein BGZ80_000612 [Entomortierella chlamydospora]|uniref:Protein kinase domain-containing protein n=1 Tax=Entomortierella chlamydospora TaxID=101097 RepID=A0A9P6N213_9FUNG|nr:hypothetical protein BGZ80_000612 [Entomortierella chlamydospora]
MASTAMQGDLTDDSDNEGPLETDPSSRYQRCDEVLGEGAYKLVYRACDLEVGNEVAWNQLRLDNLTKREARKILSEIEILQSIRNEHIINFYSSWLTPTVNGGERIVFITELMSSGTLKQYLKKTLKGALKPKVVKAWCRQILQGLAYLHARDPPIIHRDLKCDNIFINGNNGQLKIGDLGLAVVRRRTHVSSVLGTPEFMAPELYDEKYNEKVDIYAFGMCVLEMVTKEYPYSECTNQAQIYRKVTQGIMPQALEQVQDPEIKEFINCCLDHNPCTRPSAQELLDSDFLKPCLAEGEGSIPLRSDTPVSIVQPPTHVTIPEAEFTLTTVDADNKTYHIRSNLPLTPTSPQQDPLATNQPESGSQTPSVAGNQKPAPNPNPAHSHTNSEVCSIQVLQYGEAVGSRLNLKMVCTCPVAGVDGPTGTHEIKFPFDLEVDTVEDVVSEMIREKILSADDKGEAMSRMDVLVTNILQEKGQAKKVEEREVPTKKVSSLNHTRAVLPSALPSSSSEVKVDLVPLSHVALPVQQAEALPAHHPVQHPIQQSAQLPVQLPAQTPVQTPAQRTATAIRPWSPPLAPRINHALQIPPRPKSVHDLNHAVARESKPTSSSMSGISVPMMQQLSNASSNRPRERQRSISTTAFENEDDIGYTSPYRHGVSGSSVKSHRRTPSCDTSAAISKAISVPASLRIFNPPSDSTGGGRHRAQSDLGQFMASAPSFSSLLTQPTPTSETPSIASVVLSLGISSTSAIASNNNIASTFAGSKNEPEPRGEDTDSGISSGVSSPVSMGLNSIRRHEQLEPPSNAPIEIPQLVPVVQQDLLSPLSAIRAPSHTQIDDSMHPMSSSISSDGSFGGMMMMTVEAKRDIELWSDNVRRTRDQVVPTAEYPNHRSPEYPHHHIQERNGSTSSLGYPDMSDEKDEVEDEDLRVLLEQQRKELERMRLQHEMEWREMMRLKELKDRNGTEMRTRRLSEANSMTRLV